MFWHSRTSLGLALLAVVGLGAAALAEPQPSPSPITWELTIQPAVLQRIVVTWPGSGQARTYWYLVYRVINNTGQDVDFLPQIERVSEIDAEVAPQQAGSQPDGAPRLIVEPAIVGLNPAVFRAIQERHAKTNPFLVEPVRVIGRILQGIDNARDSVAVFGELDPRVSRFTIYVGGLSGERQTRPNPAYNPRRAGASAAPAEAGQIAAVKEFVLQKTLALPFTLPGDERTRRSATPVLDKIAWVMR